MKELPTTVKSCSECPYLTTKRVVTGEVPYPHLEDTCKLTMRILRLLDRIPASCPLKEVKE